MSISVERMVLDLESEAIRGPGSIPTGGNILSPEFFCFQVVKTKMPQLAILYVCEKPYGKLKKATNKIPCDPQSRMVQHSRQLRRSKPLR